jgi:hypothetical protein
MRDRGRIMTEEERLDIINWLCRSFFSLYVNGVIIGDDRKPGRVRMELSPLDPTVPIAVWRIKKRIMDKEDLRDYEIEPMMRDLVTIMLPGGQIFPHKDSSVGDYIHSRFNVFLSQPPNDFTTFYGGKPIEAKEGHYVLCRSGIDTHWTDVLKDNIPRITLSFGFLIPRKTLNQMYDFPLIKAVKSKEPMPHPMDVQDQRRKMVFLMSDRFGFWWWWTGEYGKRINGA